MTQFLPIVVDRLIKVQVDHSFLFELITIISFVRYLLFECYFISQIVRFSFLLVAAFDV